MPHIVIEAPDTFVRAIDWTPTLRQLHAALAGPGWARPEHLKSRVLPIARQLCGDDPDAQQLVATLTLTNPRPAEMTRRMAETVHEHLCDAVRKAGLPAWVQCCVFLVEVSKSNYLKTEFSQGTPP